MLTVGIDMAANPASTASCDIRWSTDAAVVESVESGLSDDAVLVALRRGSSVGVDCPFGWPDPFVDAVSAHRDRRPRPDSAGNHDRLRLRNTDVLVREDCQARNRGYRSDDERRVRVTPLSASTDRLGGMVLRWARLMSRHEVRHGVIDRSGAGPIVEVYPAAALHRWELLRSGARHPDPTVSRPVHDRTINAITTAVPGLLIADRWHQRLIESDHAFDAFVAALVARAATVPGAVDRPSTDEDRRHAGTEGWIHLPRGALASLLTGAV